MLKNVATRRVIALIVLILVLLVPLNLIDALTTERATRRDGVAQEVGALWAGSQRLAGPLLTIPMLVATTDATAELVAGRHAVHVAARSVKALVRLDTEVRHRGIYNVPVYTTTLDLTGEFVLPRIDALGSHSSIGWSEARLSLGILDPKGIAGAPAASWNGQPITFEPESSAILGPAMGALIGGLDASASGQVIPFHLALVVRGSKGLTLAPLGDTAVVSLRSSWPSPSFCGGLLPERYEISKTGSSAEWRTSAFGRATPLTWRDMELSDADVSSRLEHEAFGLVLATPVDVYQQASRSTKYGALFIVLTFLVFFLVETLHDLKVHPVQYLMVGGAICLFYLLLLSLSEHLAFGLAYLLAAGSTTLLIGAYGRAVLSRTRSTVGTVTMLLGLYACLYVLLQLEDYALLMGSVLLFGILAGVMFATRRVDWYATKAEE